MSNPSLPKSVEQEFEDWWNDSHEVDPVYKKDLKQFLAQALENQRAQLREAVTKIIDSNKLPIPNPYGTTVKVENVNKKILDKLKADLLQLLTKKE